MSNPYQAKFRIHNCLATLGGGMEKPWCFFMKGNIEREGSVFSAGYLLSMEGGHETLQVSQTFTSCQYRSENRTDVDRGWYQHAARVPRDRANRGVETDQRSSP